ncbi:MAG TPA: hypothetical protein VGN26_24025 [Armatimonadota bacterium]|jgi:hypothetical protein
MHRQSITQGLRVERPLLRLPIVLLIDDAAPGVHVYHRHFRDVHKEPTVTKDGRPLLEMIPAGFLDRFIEVVRRRGIKGKLSVVPNPGGDGPVDGEVKGVPREELREWLRSVRVELAGFMDLCPEMITHNLTVDLETGGFLPLSEHDWSQTQTEETLTPYIARALTILRAAGLRPTGVTSPWSFAEAVEADYVRAIRAAMQQVMGLRKSWYFLRVGGPDTRPEVMLYEPDRGACVVSLTPCGIPDFLWQSIDTPATDDAYVSSLADFALTDDGATGAFLESERTSGWLIWYTHWQSLFSNGTESGLRALDLAGERVSRLLGERALWMTAVEAMDYAAAAHGLEVVMDRAADGTVSVTASSPFGSRDLTFSLPCPEPPAAVTVNGELLAKAPENSSILQPMSWFHHDERLYVAADLEGKG